MEDKNSQRTIKAIIEDYRSVGLSDTFDDINNDRKKMIAKCALLKSEIISRLNMINYIEGQSGLYPNQKNLGRYKEDLNSLLYTIYDRVSKCLEDPECDSTRTIS
jgi:hypothetical protein